MTMIRPVPVLPGWWWRRRPSGPEVVRVVTTVRMGLAFEPIGRADLVSVRDDGLWISEIREPPQSSCRDSESCYHEDMPS